MRNNFIATTKIVNAHQSQKRKKYIPPPKWQERFNAQISDINI
jgi:hypothetical protein